jgi:hypothetical protein
MGKVWLAKDSGQAHKTYGIRGAHLRDDRCYLQVLVIGIALGAGLRGVIAPIIHDTREKTTC